MFTAILVKNNDCAFLSTHQSISEKEKDLDAYWKKDSYYKGISRIIILKDGVVVEQIAL